jgi:hypothetical protein
MNKFQVEFSNLATNCHTSNLVNEEIGTLERDLFQKNKKSNQIKTLKI